MPVPAFIRPLSAFQHSEKKIAQWCNVQWCGVRSMHMHLFLLWPPEKPKRIHKNPKWTQKARHEKDKMGHMCSTKDETNSRTELHWISLCSVQTIRKLQNNALLVQNDGLC